jgi:hypothetical protein
MTDRRGRLDKLLPGLTARERTAAVLRAVREGRQADRSILRATRPEQVGDMLRYLSTVDSLGFDLGLYLAYVGQRIEQLHLRLEALRDLHVCALVATNLAEYIWACTGEPITQSGYDERLQEAREALIPVAHLAQRLAEQDLSPDADQEAGDSTDGENAWQRLLDEKEKAIRQLVRDGVLAGKGEGRHLLVTAGSFDEWTGKPSRPLAEWACTFDIFPDEQAGKVEALRLFRQHAREVLSFAPLDLVLGSPALRARRLRRKTETPIAGLDDIIDGLLAALLAGVEDRHRDLRAVELAVEDVAREFDVDDPLPPPIRSLLETSTASLDEACRGLEHYIGKTRLPEPDDSDVEEVRRLLRHAEEAHSGGAVRSPAPEGRAGWRRYRGRRRR